MIVEFLRELVSVAVIPLVEHVSQCVEVVGGVQAAFADGIVVALFHVIECDGVVAKFRHSRLHSACLRSDGYADE